MTWDGVGHGKSPKPMPNAGTREGMVAPGTMQRGMPKSSSGMHAVVMMVYSIVPAGGDQVRGALRNLQPDAERCCNQL
jgi:hypothetical protein